jgi:hypothetical protein
MTILIVDSNNTHVETTATIPSSVISTMAPTNGASSTEVPIITTNGSILETGNHIHNYRATSSSNN